MRHRTWWGWLGASLLSFWLLAAALAVFSIVAAIDASPAVAADDEFSELAEDEPAAEEATDGTEPAEGRKGPNLLVRAWRALGLFYFIVFLGLSFTLVALFVMNLLTARRENVVPVALVEGFEAHLNEKRYQEAYEMAKNDESFLGQVLSAGLAKLQIGYEQAIEAMQEVGEEENMKLEHRLSYMALIGTISPMVGLLGTVQGMIGAFAELESGGSPNASILAGNIATALFTTLLGLCIAIPAIAAFSILRNRVARLVLEVGILSEGLMSRFSSVGAAGPGAKKAPGQSSPQQTE